MELAYIFKSKDVPVFYHGQLDFFDKSDNGRAWLTGKALVICATSALACVAALSCGNLCG